MSAAPISVDISDFMLLEDDLRMALECCEMSLKLAQDAGAPGEIIVNLREMVMRIREHQQ